MPTGNVNEIAWNGTGRLLAMAGEDGTVKVWDAGQGRITYLLRGHVASVKSVAWSPDGRRIASASIDGTAKEMGDVTARMQGGLNWMASSDSAWSPDGRRIVAPGKARPIPPGQDGAVLHPRCDVLLGPPGPAGHGPPLARPPSPAAVMAGTSPRPARMAGCGSGTWIGRRRPPISPVHSGEARSVAWSPDGKLLASGGWDCLVKVWDAKVCRLIGVLLGYILAVGSLARSPAWGQIPRFRGHAPCSQSLGHDDLG